MTIHDAAPAARASVESVAPQPTTDDGRGRTDKASPRPVDGTGDLLEPVAFTLTDAEREAVAFFATMQWPTQSQQIRARAATLRGLLERLGGGE